MDYIFTRVRLWQYFLPSGLVSFPAICRLIFLYINDFEKYRISFLSPSQNVKMGNLTINFLYSKRSSFEWPNLHLSVFLNFFSLVNIRRIQKNFKLMSIDLVWNLMLSMFSRAWSPTMRTFRATRFQIHVYSWQFLQNSVSSTSFRISPKWVLEGSWGKGIG